MSLGSSRVRGAGGESAKAAGGQGRGAGGPSAQGPWEAAHPVSMKQARSGRNSFCPKYDVLLGLGHF